MDKVVLFNVGRNLNRAYRTVEFFGIKNLDLCKCETAKLTGNLFAAKDRVFITEINDLPTGENVVLFETDGDQSIYNTDLTKFDTFVFGVESIDLPKSNKSKRVVIPKIGNISGLTVEAALAIVLFERNRQIYKNSIQNEPI